MTTTSAKIGTAMAWTMLSRVGRMVLGIVTSAIVVRGLGEHDYGVLSVLRSVLMFVVLLAGVGTGQALLKYLPELRVARDRAGARALVRGVLVTHVGAWLALVALAYAVQPALEGVFHIDGVGLYVLIAVVLAVFEIVFMVATHVLNASFDAARLSLATLASHVVYAVALLVAFNRGWGVVGVLGAAAAGSAVATALVWSRVRVATDFDRGPEPATSGAPVPAVTRSRVLRYSLPFAAVGVLNLVVWRQSETLLLAHFRSAEETGYFDAAYRLPQTVLEFVPGTVWPLVMAGMSEAFARDRKSLRRAVSTYYRMLFALCAPICVAGAVAGGRFVEVLYGPAMQPAAVPAQLFFVIFTVSFLSTPLSMALYVLEKTHVNLVIYLLLAVLNVGLDIVLIPRFGVYGAIVPVAIAILLQPVLYYVAVHRFDTGVRIPFGYVGRCFLGAAPLFLMAPVLAVWDGAVGLLVAACAGAIACVIGYRWARVLGDEEIDSLSKLPVPGASAAAALLGATGSKRKGK
ncbi:MAG TPA: oligosaccharide flippase family protein [Candidatus Krumholzibacteria bacterium]|nr:oligosaccharide flippase family protein [Candidatus Krumholzibacteria bacterium]